MKLTIFTLLTLSALCLAEDEENPKREGRLIHPGFVFETAYEYQSKAEEFQKEVALETYETLVAVSSVLRESTGETLQQYEDHVDEVLKAYAPVLQKFQELRESECRNMAKSQLNLTAIFTGFEASNCAQSYNSRVQDEVAKANTAIVDFDDSFNQILMIVGKSFIGKNVFVSAEDIQGRIVEMFENIQGKWRNVGPEMKNVRSSLSKVIASQNEELKNCHDENFGRTMEFYAMFDHLVDICIAFDNTQHPFAFRTMRTDVPDSAKKIYDNFKVQLSEIKNYQWKA
ncbi:CLUMA_CG016600, isoform A [Clunio marinus]|uniref:CLUMA_CG016600, isoform A n=1 Tax=Clunio marinus TaxID=568069 RepID=A0A1J1IU45_9DIPT|nr:CLUMA_CG016600, isoform A [Clunio marinus]